jgi:hypothetical protein
MYHHWEVLLSLFICSFSLSFFLLVTGFYTAHLLHSLHLDDSHFLLPSLELSLHNDTYLGMLFVDQVITPEAALLLPSI